MTETTAAAEKPIEEKIFEGTDARTPKDPAPQKRADNGKFSREEGDERALDRIFKNIRGDKPAETPAPETKAEQGQPAETQGTGTAPAVPKALELDGFTADDLKGMSQERITALEQKAQKRQADISKKLSEKAKQDTPATVASTEPSKVPDKSETQKVMKDLTKGVGELLGDDVGDALGELLEKSMKPLLERMEKAEAALNQRTMADMDSQITSAREKLGKTFPKLKDDDASQRVVERMGQIADPEVYASIHDLMEAACKLEFFDDMVKAAAEPKQQPTRNDTSRQNGQPTTPTKNGTPTAAQSREQAEDAALDAIFAKHIKR